MRAGAAACALLLAVALPAAAKDSLPWKDANPLEGTRPHKRQPAAGVKEAPKPVAAKPAPEPALPAPEPAPPADVPKPEERPAPNGETKAPDAAAATVAPEAVPVPEASPKTADAPPPANAPAATAPEAPVAAPADVPVPETRPPAPADAPSADAPMPAAAAPAPPAAVAAPNSTDKLMAREPVIDPATAVLAAAAVEDAKQCEAELTRRGVVFKVEESISEGECGVLRPVALERLSSGVRVEPKTQILCGAAMALDSWMSEGVVPAAKLQFPGERLQAFRHASTYVCRPRASETGISEHARGSAIDIGGFVFDKDRTIGVQAEAPDTPEARFLDASRASACGPFKTVLGPGTDADHATHFHLDIAARKGGATYCK